MKKLTFVQNGGVSYPTNPELFQKVSKFCEENLDKKPNLSAFQEVYVALDGEEVVSIGAWQLAADVSLFRTKKHPSSSKATKKLWDRLNDAFSDRGMDGHDVFLFISETEAEDARCPRWKEWLKAAKAKPSERVLVEVK